MSVTIKDIAKIANVSHSTVSRSLNDSPRVAVETKSKIKAIADDLGFEFNSQARSLSTSRTNTIGIIYASDFNDSSIHFTTNTVQKSIRQSLEKRDLDAITAIKDNDNTGENNIIRLINKKKIDGLIIMGADIDYKTLDYMTKSNIPFVFCQNIPDSDLDVDAIYCDHFLGGYEATKHLIKEGHKKILCLQRKDSAIQFKQRTEGYEAAMKDYHIPYTTHYLAYANNSLDGGYSYGKDNIDFIKQFSAIFVHTDAQALGLIQALKEEGILIPTDISIVGYDDIYLGSFYQPHLTTIHQPIDKLAILTCERLIDLLDKKIIVSLNKHTYNQN